MGKTSTNHDSDDTTDSMNSSKLDFLWKIIQRYDFYYGSTNTKAQYILTFNTFILGVSIFKLETIFVPFANHKTLTWILIITLLALLVSTLVSLIISIFVIYPYTKSKREPNKYHSMVFYGDVCCFSDRDQYYQNIFGASVQTHINDLSFQAYELAVGLDKKMRRLKYASWPMLYGVIPSILVIVILNIILIIMSL